MMMQGTSLFQSSSPAGSTGAQQSWKAGPVKPAIWQKEVHVWRVRLDAPWSWTFDEALSLEDRTRSDRFKFESDRRKFCVARASLRLILGRYLQIKPGRLQLQTNEFGKPFLPRQKRFNGIRFNLSHSHELALIAITRDREVGIDVEFMRPEFVSDEMAMHFFSRVELEQFRSVPEKLRTESFFNCWTRKEAYIKARGEGLYCPLDQFDVFVAPGTPAMLLESRIGLNETERWSFHDINADDRYAASVAVENGFSRLVLWDLIEP